MRNSSLYLSLSLSFLALTACGTAAEGQNPGECADGADNDGNGAFDCDDGGCSGSPDCAGGDDTAASQNAAPSGAAIAITPATPGDDDDLTCSIVTEATDPNGDTVTYRYAWKVNGGDAGISGQTVSAAQTSGGESWTCTVTPNDGVLDGTPASVSVTIAQGNRAPSAPTVSINPAEPTDDDVLTCVIDTESVDPDGDAVTYTYAWSVDGADTGLTGTTVSPSSTESGEQWTCTVTASDGDLENASASASVEIASASGSCKEILDAGASVGDGTYSIDPDGAGEVSVTCDMTTAGGGWTAIFLSEDLNYYSSSIDYTFDSVALRADATDTLIGFANASGVGVTDWASFALPADWVAASPMSYEGSSTSASVTLQSGATSTMSLYYGYWNFDGECGDWQGPTTDRFTGRVGFCSAGAPYWAGFNRDVESTDYCNAWSGTWAGSACTSGRRFAMYVR